MIINRAAWTLLIYCRSTEGVYIRSSIRNTSRNTASRKEPRLEKVGRPLRGVNTTANRIEIGPIVVRNLARVDTGATARVAIRLGFAVRGHQSRSLVRWCN